MPPNETPAEFSEIRRSPWKRAKQDNEIYEHAVKRAKVNEIVVKDEADIMESEMQYFPIHLSCGACPTSNNLECDTGMDLHVKVEKAPYKISLLDIVPSFESTKKFQCPLCQYSKSTSAYDLWSHLTDCRFIANNSINKCCFCSQKVKNVSGLLKHVKIRHCWGKCISCTSFVSQVEIKSHSLSHIMSLNGNNCSACSDIATSISKHFSTVLSHIE